MARKVALGRGLKALIPDTPRARSGLAEIPLDHLRANPAQPRRHFEHEALEALAASIAEHGMLQPLLVSEDGVDRYVVIAGERRLRAARIAGLERVPAVIRERVEADGELELALVENLQRRDLTPLEEATAFADLRDRLGLSQAEIARRVGIDRSTVANALRLLRLAEPIRALVEEGRLSAGHARALLAFGDDEQRLAWARRVVDTGLSVRELERAASVEGGAAGARRQRPAPPPRDPNLVDAEQRLSLRLGARVEIRAGRRGGSIVIRCATQRELMRLFERLLEGSEECDQRTR